MDNIGSILVVEDDPDGQEFLAMVLQHMGLKHVLTNNAQVVEQLIETETFGAVIIDLALPDKDGWQLLKSIQRYDRYANVPCIAITAYHTSKTRADALQAGFVAYIPKPLNARDLVQKLEDALN